MWSSDAIPTTVRWFAWEVLKIDGTSLTQAGDFLFIDRDSNKFIYPSSTSATLVYKPSNVEDDTPWPSNEGPLNLLDGNPSTKLCMQFAFEPFMIAYDMKSECLDLKTYNRYQWFTANDSIIHKRNPLSWRVHVSNDGETWFTIDEVIDNPAPTSNLSLAYTSKELI